MSRQEWTTVITPRRHGFATGLSELWRYRDLYLMYVRRDVVTVYKQTILGPLWFVIQPLLTMMVYVVVFGDMVGVPTGGAPKVLFYLSGIILWSYFNSVFLTASDMFVTNRHVFSKVYFPRLIVPLASATSNLIKLLIQLCLYALIFIWGALTARYDVGVNISLLMLPVVVAATCLLSLSLGLIISSLTTRYRDLTKLVAFGLQLLMYASPVIYPLSAVPDRFKTIVALNPLTAMFEWWRASLIGATPPNEILTLYSVAFIVISVVMALWLFSRIERNFIDTV